MPQRYALEYLELPSSDGLATRTFFTDAFGWAHTSFGPHYESIAAGLELGIDSSERRGGGPLPGIRTENLEEAEQDVVAAGGVITVPAYDFPGGRRFHFRAPGGTEFLVFVYLE